MDMSAPVNIPQPSPAPPPNAIAVSPTGRAQGAPQPNNGAAFGPDTPGTQTAGLQEAVQALGAAGGSLRLMPGQFMMNAPVLVRVPDVHIYGSGGEATLLFSQGPQDRRIFDIQADRVSLHALGIDGNAAQKQGPPADALVYFTLCQFGWLQGVHVHTAVCDALAFYRADYGTVRGCQTVAVGVPDRPGRGITFTASSNCRAQNNRIDGRGGFGRGILANGVGGVEASHNVITHNVVVGAAKEGIAVLGDPKVPDKVGVGNVVRGNYVEACVTAGGTMGNIHVWSANGTRVRSNVSRHALNGNPGILVQQAKNTRLELNYSCDDGSAPVQTFGILDQTPAQAGTSLVGNVCPGNVQGAVKTAATPSGGDPGGPSVVPVSASPFVWSSPRPSPVVVHLFGGSAAQVQVQGSAGTRPAGQKLPLVVPLGQGEQISITFSGPAPTLVAMDE
jgi:hypothetical protein